MNVSTMLDITRSAPAPHLMRGHARLLPDIFLFSLVFYNLEKASLVATTRDHNLSIQSPVGMAHLSAGSRGSRTFFSMHIDGLGFPVHDFAVDDDFFYVGRTGKFVHGIQ